LRNDQPVSLVGAFEEPVSVDGGHVRQSADRLVAYLDDIDLAYGVARVATWATALPGAGEAAQRLGGSVPLPDLLDGLEHTVQERMATRAKTSS
jgi:CRISPR system Cascade subunit CasC